MGSDLYACCQTGVMSLSTIIEDAVPVGMKGINLSLGRKHFTMLALQLDSAASLLRSKLLYDSKESMRVMPCKRLLSILQFLYQLGFAQALTSAS